jgi:hypothetical protein
MVGVWYWLRNAIVWTAAASFAALSLVGEGLHWLPGSSHARLGSCCCRQDQVASLSCCPGHGTHRHGDDSAGAPEPNACGHGCCGHEQAPPEPVPSEDREPEPGDEPTRSEAERECPICRLMAQAKTPLVLAALPDAGEPVRERPVHRPDFFRLLLARTFDARGPPLSA